VEKPFYRSSRGALRPVPFTKPLVLCVEDDETCLQLRKQVLEEEGYNVIGATTAKDALETLREAPVCCMIADHKLKGETGVELAKNVKKIKRDVPVILYSGAIPGSLQNIDAYVNKGEPTATFLRVVRDVLERYFA
jgi:DNA-binding NtrC family response regulator